MRIVVALCRQNDIQMFDYENGKEICIRICIRILILIRPIESFDRCATSSLHVH